MTSFILKIIAIISMAIDHIGIAYFKYTTSMNVIGRIAFPIFAFQISEGYTHTKNLKKYFFRLFLFALISQIPFFLFESLFMEDYSLNIFFTLFFGLLCIFIYDKICNSSHHISKKKWLDISLKYILAFTVIFFIGILAQVCNFDYGFFGIAIIFLFYFFRNHKVLMAISFILACIINYLPNIIKYPQYIGIYSQLCLFTILPIIFICMYNKKQGKKIKYFLYAFYPIHLLLIYIVFGLIFK